MWTGRICIFMNNKDDTCTTGQLIVEEVFFHLHGAPGSTGDQPFLPKQAFRLYWALSVCAMYR